MPSITPDRLVRQLWEWVEEFMTTASTLDFAIKEFQDMKMQPSLERAFRHKEILKA